MTSVVSSRRESSELQELLDNRRNLRIQIGDTHDNQRMADQPTDVTEKPASGKDAKIKILVAVQTQNDGQIDAVEVEADYFHNGQCYVVLGHGVPHAEHYNLGQAAMDWIRVALLDSDFMIRNRKSKSSQVPQIESSHA